MNGIDYFKRAEQLADRVASGACNPDDAPAVAAAAQAFATLALAAATADATAFKRELARANGVEPSAPSSIDRAAFAAAFLD
ncbi:hypothetical protein ABZ632_21845 [Streptomyces albidoflavus]|uniref:hypothetical protein n=1 Tax=Streptomyces TaxID=1883 RepID=UPI0033D30171|nr:hypothetical protein [Streptomyces sp. L06]